jgi:hypothetical protein
MLYWLFVCDTRRQYRIIMCQGVYVFVEGEIEKDCALLSPGHNAFMPIVCVLRGGEK